MDVFRKFKVFCVTENIFVESWGVTAPECCPTDTRHIIDAAQTAQIDQQYISTNIQPVYISSKSYGTTNGIYCCEGRSYTIPANVTTHVENIDIPVGMCVFGMRFCVREEHMGDTVSFVGLPETVVGVILDTTNPSMTTIPVSSTVSQNVVAGYYIKIDGEERQVVAVNTVEQTITVATPFTNVHAAGSLVMLNVYVVRNCRLDVPGAYDVGYGAFGGKVIPQGSVLRMIYTKADPATTKCFSFNVEFMY